MGDWWNWDTRRPQVPLSNHCRFESDIPHHYKEDICIEETIYRKEPVRGCEEYSVDTNGVIYSKRGLPLKYSTTKRGYHIVTFSIAGKLKSFSVHQVVARQFIPNDNPARNQVNHKNGITTDNRVCNLEWMTNYENMRHRIDVLKKDMTSIKHHSAKRIQAFDKKTGKRMYTFAAMSDAARYISDKYNICFKNTKMGIWKAVSGRRKSYKGLIWQYI